MHSRHSTPTLASTTRRPSPISAGTPIARCHRAALATPALLVVAGCDGPLSTLAAAGPMADSIATLWWVMLVGAVALFALVLGLFAYVYLRPSQTQPSSARRWIVYGGLVMPTVVLTALVSYALVIGERLLAHPDAEAVRVAAHGQMWRWRFSYPDNPEWGETAALHIPAQRAVDVTVTSGDVIHSFWVPRLAGKIDAIPGRENVLRIKADRAERYGGVCAEFCGAGHGPMIFEVVAHPPDDYVAAMRSRAPLREPTP